MKVAFHTRAEATDPVYLKAVRRHLTDVLRPLEI